MPAEPPRRGWWIAKRFLLAAAGIVLVSGGATAVVALNEVGRLVEALRQNKPIKVAPHVLAPTSRGAPETLLLVGNDERRHTTTTPVLPHSNEMLLVRIDPSQPTISMLSIPRELKVPIDKPDGEVDETRINAAYQFGWENGGGTAGGVNLMVKTIEEVLGITVNEVFIANFNQFERAVNEMGCVYMTVDKRYYHSNSEPEAEQYMEINLQPGYQRLCGKHAREFVSNRHESSSLIRDARDQRFLLNVKAQYGGSLFEEREKFEDIFGKNVENTLKNEEEILQLVYLLAESAGKPVRQVPFDVTELHEYDIATPEQILEAVHSFLTGTAKIPKQKLNVAATHAPVNHALGSPAVSSLSPTPSSTLAEARTMAASLPFPVEAPRYQQTTAESEPDEMRHYPIHGPGGHLYPTYVIVVAQGETGQYYDVQGSTWTNPPLLQAPDNTIAIGSRTYSLYYDGEHLRTVAWSEAGAAYWIENTLTDSLSAEQMVAIARETRPVTGHLVAQASAGIPTAPLRPGHVNLPPPTLAAPSLLSKIGALLGFVGAGVVALLALRVLTRQRELKLLREQIAHAMTLEARQHQLLPAAGILPQPEPPNPAGLAADPASGALPDESGALAR